ncbi:MAG: protein-glutamate methylesterase/protein-glutamine glutaminase [Acidobacteriaceae bacterium]
MGDTRLAPPTRDKIRVLVVDDSVVFRSLVSRMVEQDPLLELVGTARNGADAVAKIPRFQPDLVTLDVEMPELDGLGALRQIAGNYPHIRVIMFSSLTARGAQVTVEALMAGASDYMTKPSGGPVSSDSFLYLARDLSSKIRGLFPARVAGQRKLRAVVPTLIKPVFRPAPLKLRLAPRVFVIGVSTGGPSALAEIVPQIPADFPLPIAIVQHMPPHFTRLLAERLARVSKIPVVEAADGMIAAPGTALIAPGDYHMRLVQDGARLKVSLNQQPPENSCRPAVDVLFRSVADACQGAVVAAVLTGMGQDGLLGVRQLKDFGATVFAQDRASSVVWGMPGAVAKAGLADATLPLHQIVPTVLDKVGCR